MRTTITVDDELLAEVKQVAARTHRTVSSVVEDSLRTFLARNASVPAWSGLPISGDTTPPLVDILDADALAEALGDDAA